MIKKCNWCSKRIYGKKRRCKECALKFSEYVKNRKIRLKKEGYCIECAKNKIDYSISISRCPICLLKLRSKAKKYNDKKM